MSWSTLISLYLLATGSLGFAEGCVYMHGSCFGVMEHLVEHIGKPKLGDEWLEGFLGRSQKSRQENFPFYQTVQGPISKCCQVPILPKASLRQD